MSRQWGEFTDFFLNKELRPSELPTAKAVIGAEQEARPLYRLDERKPAQTANPQEDYKLFQIQVKADLLQDKLDKWAPRHLAETYVRLTTDFGGCDFDQSWFGETSAGNR